MIRIWSFQIQQYQLSLSSRCSNLCFCMGDGTFLFWEETCEGLHVLLAKQSEGLMEAEGCIECCQTDHRVGTCIWYRKYQTIASLFVILWVTWLDHGGVEHFDWVVDFLHGMELSENLYHPEKWYYFVEHGDHVWDVWNPQGILKFPDHFLGTQNGGALKSLERNP